MKSPYLLHRLPARRAITWIAGISLLALVSGIAPGQTVCAHNAAASQDDKENEIPKVRGVMLKTKDGIQLSTYYFAGNLGKEAMPVIILHGWQESSLSMKKLALRIQREGHAVLVPDLRGHGKSTTAVIRKANGQTNTRQLDLDDFAKIDILRMNLDVETCKRFLMKEHNKGECNIEKLCVIGADMGALVALNWAVIDWNQQATPFLKQGQDVKSLVLLSSPASFKGVTNQLALVQPVVRGGLNTLLLVGNGDRTSLSETKRLYNRMERFHGTKPEDSEALKAHRLFLIELETAAQGSSLLRVKNLKPDPTEIIWIFLRNKIVNRDTLTIAGTDFMLEWKRRGNIFEEQE
jgi:pimeloyl-ACP methyl ester carboxylesterase